MAVVTTPQAGDALVIVDVQNDFLPGGALAVPNGDEVIPVLKRYIAIFEAKGLPIFATRDWHPANHCSFRAQGGPWPDHCIAATRGAAFPSALMWPASAIVISKGNRVGREAYSGFEGTDLEQLLRLAGLRRLFVGGLATDYCVLNTVRDARARGFDVFLLSDAIRAVNIQPEDGRKAEQEMRQRGAVPVTLESLIS
ncbi:MAG: isochorismatase family protein [Verrucomicrobiales bacterium]|nr:isochorismatase family protein [Verrucomicrobiales bacterium]